MSETAQRATDRPWFVIGLIGIGFSARLVFAPALALIPEESYYWLYSRHLAPGYLDHPPLVGWLIALSTALFGRSELAVRLPAALSWLVTAAFMFGLGRNLFSRRVARDTVLLLSLLPFFFGTGLFMTPDAPLLAAWAGCLYFLERVLFGRVAGAWIGYGLCLGVGLLAKYTAFLLVPATFVLLVLDRPSRGWLRNWRLPGAIALALTIMSPAIAWNARNDWVSFLYQGPQRWSGPTEFGLVHLLLAAAALLSPVGLYACVRAVLPWHSLRLSRAGLVHPTFRRHLFATVLAWVPLAVFVAHGFFKVPRLNWTGPIWLVTLPFVAATWSAGIARERRWWRSPLSPVTAIALLTVLGGVLFWGALGAPGSGSSEQGALYPWRAIGREVAVLRSELRGETGREPIVVGMDTSETASQVTFYDPDADPHNTTGRHLLGEWSEGFGTWMDPASAHGRDLILVGFDLQSLERPGLSDLFAELGPVQERRVGSRNGRRRCLYYRVGYLYRGRSTNAQGVGGSDATDD